eukprot:EG_transcript_10107
MNFAKRSLVPAPASDPSRAVAPRRNVLIDGLLPTGTPTTKQICLDDLERQTMEAFHAKVLSRFGATAIEVLKFYSREIDGYVDVDEFSQLQDGMKLRVELAWAAPPPALRPPTSAPASAPALPRNLLRIGALTTSLGRDWSVRARILSKEEMRKHSTGCPVFRIEILDAVGDRIDVVFWEQCAVQHFPKLEAGRVYIFGSGTVSRNKLHQGLQINMRLGCRVQEDLDDGTIPLKAVPMASLTPPAPFLSTDVIQAKPLSVVSKYSPSGGTLHIPIGSVRSAADDAFLPHCRRNTADLTGDQPSLKRQRSDLSEEELPAKSPVEGCRLCERPVAAGEELCLECGALVDPTLVTPVPQHRQPDDFYARGAASRAEAQHQFDRGVLQRQTRLAARALLRDGIALTVQSIRQELIRRDKMPPKFDPKGRHPREAYLTQPQIDEVLEGELQAILQRQAKTAERKATEAVA